MRWRPKTARAKKDERRLRALALSLRSGEHMHAILSRDPALKSNPVLLAAIKVRLIALNPALDDAKVETC